MRLGGSCGASAASAGEVSSAAGAAVASAAFVVLLRLVGFGVLVASLAGAASWEMVSSVAF